MQATTAETSSTSQPAGAAWRALRTPSVIALVALLALQLSVALVLGLGVHGMGPAESRGPLVTFDREDVTGIHIEAPDREPVLVAKTGNGWVIPALGDLPAAEHKVTELLTKIEGLEKGLPVATSEQALKRFKVAEDSFERRLRLEGSDGALTSLYLGDSAGFRRLFVRADGDDAVYEAELGLFDAPDKADGWSDRTLLHLTAHDIRQLRFGNVTLERSDDGWRLADLAEGEELDSEAIEDLVRDLAGIDFVGVLAEDELPTASQDESTVEIEATLASGDAIGYKISKIADSDDYLLEVSNRPQRFRMAAYAADGLTGIGRTDLLKEQEQTDE